MLSRPDSYFDLLKMYMYMYYRRRRNSFFRVLLCEAHSITHNTYQLYQHLPEAQNSGPIYVPIIELPICWCSGRTGWHNHSCHHKVSFRSLLVPQHLFITIYLIIVPTLSTCINTCRPFSCMAQAFNLNLFISMWLPPMLSCDCLWMC